MDRDHDPDRRAHDHQVLRGEDERADLLCVARGQRVSDIGSSEHDQDRVLEDQARREGQDEENEVLRAPPVERLDDEVVHRPGEHATDEGGGEGLNDDVIGRTLGDERTVGPEGHEFAVGEVGDVGHAVLERQRDGRQGDDRRRDKAEADGEEDVLQGAPFGERAGRLPEAHIQWVWCRTY